MFKISQLGSSNPEGCPFVGDCPAGDAFCEKTQILADAEHYKKAKSLGLKPKLGRESWLTDNFDSDNKLTQIEICPNAAKDPVIVDGLGQFLEEVSPGTLIEDPELSTTLREIEGVIGGSMDIDEVTTEEGFSLIDRITGGEEIINYPVDYKISVLNGAVERLPVFELAGIEE